MPVPGLHVVTNDEVLATPGFHERALRLLAECGPAIALHLRGPGTPPARLLSLAATLTPAARDANAVLLINDRLDVALASGAHGVQLAQRSMPVAAARSLHPDWVMGASVHGVEEAMAAEDADFLLLGTIWESASHPGRSAAGLSLVRQVCERVRHPVIVIGGVTPDRAEEARAAGAAGAAAVRGIWGAPDPVEAAAEYLASMNQRPGERA